jgi:hypothetical protein
VAERIRGCDRLGTVVDRLRADEAVGPRARQRANGAREALLRQALRLTRARPEAGTPEQPLGLGRTERSAIDGQRAGRDAS